MPCSGLWHRSSDNSILPLGRTYPPRAHWLSDNPRAPIGSACPPRAFWGTTGGAAKAFWTVVRWPGVDLAGLVDKDIALTERALAKARIGVPGRSHLRKVAEDFLSMARAYYEDSKHFREKGELEKALANVNYAHGWLDAGARLGLFDVDLDDTLFTLNE